MPDPLKRDGDTCALTGVLHRVLDRLEETEVDGRLDRWCAASDSPVDDLDVDRHGPRRRAHSVAETTLPQDGRVDAVRQFAKVVDGGGRVFADLVELGCEFGSAQAAAAGSTFSKAPDMRPSGKANRM
jgi:hypothetical protein